MQSTKSLILMNYKIRKKKKTNHIYSIKIITQQRLPVTTCSILLKIRKKKWSWIALNLGKNFNMWLIIFILKNNLNSYLYFYDKNCV